MRHTLGDRGRAAWASLAELQALGQWRSLSAAAHYLDERAETRQRALGLVEV